MSNPMGFEEVLAGALAADINRERDRLALEAAQRQSWLSRNRGLSGTVGLDGLMDKGANTAVEQDAKPLDVPKKEVTPNGRIPLPPGATR